MINPDQFEQFGVCLILPECAFKAEIPRDDMLDRLNDIDEQLTERGIPDEDATRLEIMVDNARNISSMMSRKEINDGTEGISDIAYSFVYALGKMIGMDRLPSIRGLTGSFLRNTLRMNPCLAEIDYKLESDSLSKRIADHEEDEEWDISISDPPVIH